MTMPTNDPGILALNTWTAHDTARVLAVHDEQLKDILLGLHGFILIGTGGTGSGKAKDTKVTTWFLISPATIK
jgi:hypothetical protein